jgi:hypothetical protein
MNSRKSRVRAIVPAAADFKWRAVVTGANSPTLDVSRPRLGASLGAMVSIRLASEWTPSGRGARFAPPDDIRQALPSETGDPSALTVMIFDKMPPVFMKTVISTEREEEAVIFIQLARLIRRGLDFGLADVA